MKKFRFLGFAGALCAALAGSCAVMAQSWPAKPVRVVVPFGTGGGGTIQARLITDSLRQSMGAIFVIDNRPGGYAPVRSEKRPGAGEPGVSRTAGAVRASERSRPLGA